MIERQRTQSRTRVFTAAVAIAAALVGAAVSASATSQSPAGDAGGASIGYAVSTPTAGFRSAASSVVASSAIACPAAEGAPVGCGGYPVPCCATAGASGVTATGSATEPGRGAGARDDAIRKAVADARDQAETAVRAAGGRLGAVLAVQISSYGYPYPLLAGAEQGGIAPSCPAGSTCPVQPRPSPSMSVTVTVTWAVA